MLVFCLRMHPSGLVKLIKENSINYTAWVSFRPFPVLWFGGVLAHKHKTNKAYSHRPYSHRPWPLSSCSAHTPLLYSTLKIKSNCLSLFNSYTSVLSNTSTTHTNKPRRSLLTQPLQPSLGHQISSDKRPCCVAHNPDGHLLTLLAQLILAQCLCVCVQPAGSNHTDTYQGWMRSVARPPPPPPLSQPPNYAGVFCR